MNIKNRLIGPPTVLIEFNNAIKNNNDNMHPPKQPKVTHRNSKKTIPK